MNSLIYYYEAAQTDEIKFREIADLALRIQQDANRAYTVASGEFQAGNWVFDRSKVKETINRLDRLALSAQNFYAQVLAEHGDPRRLAGSYRRLASDYRLAGSGMHYFSPEVSGAYLEIGGRSDQ